MEERTVFGADEIKQLVQKELNSDVTIPENHKFANVVFFNKDTVNVAIAWKVTNHWVVELRDSYNYEHGNEIGVISKLTW